MCIKMIEKYWHTPRGVLANVSAHARTLNPTPQTAIVIIVDVVIKIVVRGQKNLLFFIKVLAISDDSNFSIFFVFLGGSPNIYRHFSSSFTLISAHTNFHNPRTTPSRRKVIRYRERKEKNICTHQEGSSLTCLRTQEP
jgi:hypothetical protein